MPEGKSAQGILVTGFGFGPKNNGDIPSARAHKDGTFQLRVPSDHGYALGIEDLEWASDPWTGLILASDSARPAEIAIKVYRATPLTVRVTRGADREPVANAFLELRTIAVFHWTDRSGKDRSAMGGASTWLKTDSSGMARAGVGRGNQRLRLSDGDWTEERTIEVTSEKPLEVAFHRAWTGRQQIAGRLTKDGDHYAPSGALVARAWAPQPSGFLPLAFNPQVQPDGTFTVDFDAEFVSLFFIDPEQKRCGFLDRVDGNAHVAVTMEPMTANYSGQMLDENNKPMSGRTLEFSVRNSDRKAVVAHKTDEAGSFRFTGLPCNVPLQLQITDEPGRPFYFLADGERIFKPGEERENDPLKPRRIGKP
jgi:hypothetical protein